MQERHITSELNGCQSRALIPTNFLNCIQEQLAERGQDHLKSLGHGRWIRQVNASSMECCEAERSSGVRRNNLVRRHRETLGLTTISERLILNASPHAEADELQS